MQLSPIVHIEPTFPVVGETLLAVVSGVDPTVKVERYFWFSKISKCDNIRALAGNFDKYAPTKKLRGCVIAVTVHFKNGTSVTSMPTNPCTAPLQEGHEGNADIAPPPHIPRNSNLRSTKILEYDTSKYNFSSVIAKYLDIVTPLDMLHVGFNSPKKMKPEQHYKGCHDRANWSRDNGGNEFVKLFDRFVVEVIQPEMCQGTVVYQAKPSLRIQPPGSTGIRMHRDAEYHHQAGEVNWWLPLTDCYETNTLQLESAPDRGDFEPVRVRLGQVVRFWGNQCRHGTLQNKTPICRVSLDFRVVCAVDFEENAAIGLRPDGSQRFKLGGYYRSTASFPHLVHERSLNFCSLLPRRLCAWSGDQEAEEWRRRRRTSPYSGRILVLALPFLAGDGKFRYTEKKWVMSLVTLAVSCRLLYHAVAAQVDSHCIAPKMWRDWRNVRLEEVRSRVDLVDTPSNLDARLGEAARTGIPPSFASQFERSSYTLRHLSSRAGHLANILCLTTPSWIPQVFMRLVFGSKELAVVSLGGGPGLDLIAVALASGFLSGASRSSVACRASLYTVVLDFEAGWQSCAQAVKGAYSSVFEWEGSDFDSLLVKSADITKPLEDAMNVEAKKALFRGPTLVTCAHVVAENAASLRSTNFVFFRELFAAVRPDTLIVFTEATHRVWPALVLVAFQSALGAKVGFDVSLPQVKGKRGFSLVLHKKREEVGCFVEMPLCVDDLEELLDSNCFSLLQRFEQDSNKHLQRFTNKKGIGDDI